VARVARVREKQRGACGGGLYRQRKALARGPKGGAGRGCVTGAETGAARSGSTRARPEEEDDRRVPPVGETQEEGGDAGRNGQRVGCRSTGPLLTTEEKNSWATGLAGWAAKAGSGRSKKEELGEEKETQV
jgi:hypothetical protein